MTPGVVKEEFKELMKYSNTTKNKSIMTPMIQFTTIVSGPFKPPSNTYEGWNFNFGNTPLDWIQELLE